MVEQELDDIFSLAYEAVDHCCAVQAERLHARRGPVLVRALGIAGIDEEKIESLVGLAAVPTSPSPNFGRFRR